MQPFLIGSLLSALLVLSAAPKLSEAVVPKPVSSPFVYTFGSTGVLDEAGSMANSSSPYFWLNSGGQFVIEGGVGKTLQGEVEPGLKWQLAYLAGNLLDTDRGAYPQNLFRLVTSSKWENMTQEVDFKITKIHMTDTPNRDGYSGILLFNRYKDGDNLYYTGVRQDGSAIIKKKIGGKYYTMAMAKVYGSDAAYDKDTNPNLIPGNKWIGLKSEVKDLANGDVSIVLYVDKNNTGSWQKVVSAVDSGSKYGAAPIKGLGYAGIRSDYMDLHFDNYKLVEL